jgi:polyhydroxyalkanoate synthesis regulator phasin
MRKLIATISIITALGVGAFALNAVLPAGAVGSATTPAPDPSTSCGGPRAKFKGVLDNLVTDGTITQAQEDAIIQAMKDAKAADKPAGGRHGGVRLKALEGMLQVSADTIGVSVDDLKTALKSGQSVADVANAHTVNPSDVITAIVNAGTAKIDQAVTDGKLTQAQADKLKGHLPKAADKFVNHTKPAC